MSRDRVGLLLALICLSVGSSLSGCRSAGTTGHEPGAERATELPTYERLYEGAERRVGTLDRLWAVAVVGLRYTDEDGERRRDQGEGHFQMVRPSELALFVGKLGEPYLILGSNESQYWWIERLDTPVATVGVRSEAQALSMESIGVPVLPSDLLLAMDVQHWPEPGAARASGLDPSVVWSSLEGVDVSRTVVVELRDAERIRRVHVDAFTLDPVAVEVMSASGEVIAFSRLSEHAPVANRIGSAIEPRIPMRIEVDVPAAEARIELSLQRAEMSNRRPKPVVFDLDELLERFRVRVVRRIGAKQNGLGA